MKNLAYDLKNLIRNYDKNPKISKVQRDVWHRDGKRASIRQTDFCKSNKNGSQLILPEGDGSENFDGKPVVDISYDAGRRIFEYDNIHTFLTSKILNRISDFFRLNIYASTHLLLKGQFERHCAEQAGFAQGGDQLLRDILFSGGNPDFDAYQASFAPDVRELYALPSLKEQAEAHGYISLEHFVGLVDHMIASNCYLLGIEDDGFNAFVAEEEIRLQLLKEGTPEERGRFWALKHEWLNLVQKSDQLAHQVESERLKSAEIQRQWLVLFGQLELELQSLSYRVSYLERAIYLKKAQPSASEVKIVEQLDQEEKQQTRKISELRQQVLMAPLLDKSLLEGTPTSASEISREQKVCKRLLLKIKKLLHPDHLLHQPAYQKLDEPEKERLHEMLLEALAIKPEELGIPRKFANSNFRTRHGLTRVLKEIRKILKSSDVDTNVELDIKGEDLNQKLVWLGREIDLLTTLLLTEEAHLQSFVEDEEIRRKRSILDHPDSHEKIKEDYGALIEEARAKAEEIEQIYQALFTDQNR
ncbi:MAG TPA: hypothetical protein DCS30_12055 [Rhizobiales bacterium]|nr:hypothetical protein [Hyphomicrobiales bacterium]